MPEFTDLKEAFTWWLENEYPKLKTEDKTILKVVKYDFLRRNKVSSDKIQEIMAKYGNLKLTINYDSKKDE